MRELVEMQYQSDEPFVVDSSTTTDELGVEATPMPTTRMNALSRPDRA
jgi:hypothetical protein